MSLLFNDEERTIQIKNSLSAIGPFETGNGIDHRGAAAAAAAVATAAATPAASVAATAG